ncbi:hypothetical protein V7654_14065 [Bacillus sp. JJ1609]|uniref:hypothetical protein n=1 Tax=Bacillus sp. JJ1609 TaxID=3122977 RepID=UPI002FFDAE61
MSNSKIVSALISPYRHKITCEEAVPSSHNKAACDPRRQVLELDNFKDAFNILNQNIAGRRILDFSKQIAYTIKEIGGF